ncbi:MAG TPA: glycosyltransferase family 4 protein [Bacteroidota bacterium]
MADRQNLTVLFISAFHTPFIQDDIDLLERHFTVRKKIGHGLGAALSIAVGAFGSDVVFCWFASVYAFIGVAFGKLFGMKSVVVVGGVDVAGDEELKYGLWLSPWRGRLVRFALRGASRVLVVDPSLKDDAIRLAAYDGGNIRYLPTGYNPMAWKPAGEKEPEVLTVAVVNERSRLKVKGIDSLVEAARRLPGMTFTVIGVDERFWRTLQPPLNMRFLPIMARSELLPYYQRSKVYCQPSLREGLPNTLCEAMLCGCLPVGSDTGGIRTAVGETGILVPPGEIESLVEALQKAIGAASDAGLRARARIVAMFPREKRDAELLTLLDSFAQ